MALALEDLCKRAAEFELRESENIILDPVFVSTLEDVLVDVYTFLRPGPLDYERRELMIRIFNAMAKDIFGDSSGFPVVEAFGSFTMDLFTASSDLDLSVNFSNAMVEYPRQEKISVLKKFTKELYRHQRRKLVSGIAPVLRARVPVLKVIDNGTGIECDISIENKDGISRSMILSIVSSIDERFKILSYLMKFWAKAHKINSSKDGTLSSLSIISLVAFHLQTRNPPILPPFSMLLKDGTDASSIQNCALRFKNFGRRNRESIAELFVSLLNKLLSVEALWSHGLCASTYDGLWICKTWQSGVGNVSVEDFLDRSQNFARSVGKAEMENIYKCIRSSYKSLSRFMKGQIDPSKLRKLMFRSDNSHILADQVATNEEINLKRTLPFHGSAAPFDPVSSKRMRYSEGTNELHHPHFTSSLDLSIPRPPPPLPFQSIYEAHHQESTSLRSQPDYMSQYNSLSLPPIAPEMTYSSHSFPRPPFTPPRIFYGSEQQPQRLFVPHFELDHRPPPPYPIRLDHELQYHHHDENMMLLRPRNDGPGNLQSVWYNNRAEHRHHPYVTHPQANGLNYL